MRRLNLILPKDVYKRQELKESGEILDVTVKGVVNGGVIVYVEGIRGFVPASKLALTYVEDTNEYLNKPIQVQVIDVDKEKNRLILSAKEILREKLSLIHILKKPLMFCRIRKTMKICQRKKNWKDL